jgi:hypothetical protein
MSAVPIVPSTQTELSNVTNSANAGAANSGIFSGPRNDSENARKYAWVILAWIPVGVVLLTFFIKLSMSVFNGSKTSPFESRERTVAYIGAIAVGACWGLSMMCFGWNADTPYVTVGSIFVAVSILFYGFAFIARKWRTGSSGIIGTAGLLQLMTFIMMLTVPGTAGTNGTIFQSILFLPVIMASGAAATAAYTNSNSEGLFGI